MRDITRALNSLKQHESGWPKRSMLSFSEFLQEVVAHPTRFIRNVLQVYADMISTFVADGVDEYSDDPESIRYLSYDCSKLFVENSDRPFFADRLFANRLMRHVEGLSVGAQQNKIYIFEGPHGSGKSTFLYNLLRKFEEYANTPEGRRYEVVWRLKRDQAVNAPQSLASLTERLAWLLENKGLNNDRNHANAKEGCADDNDPGAYFDVPCPSHDNPFLIIPKDVRRRFFDELFENDKFKWHLFTEKKYEWVFEESPCTICTSIFQNLLKQYDDPLKVLEFVYARPFAVNRRLGEGISVFNPGDAPLRQNVHHNEVIQRNLDTQFCPSRPVSFLYSSFAKTNNGIYALMDIKSHNMARLMELHNIISDGVHKVEDIEERVNSLFFALMNPEDRKVITDLQAFSDRIEFINVPYILDLKTEVEIYREIFGRHIDGSFLPRVLHNFARVIIATRLRTRSEAMLEWIPDPSKYELYCDSHLQLLKMEIFTGFIPPWLSEEDVAAFTAKRRMKIIAESEKDGWKGLSGRDSIKLFNEFYTIYGKDDKLIDMSMLGKFFRKYCKEDRDILPMGFLDSLQRMYNYAVLQEVKESLYYYNEEQIAREIQNYLFAVNFEPGSVEKCTYTGERLEINDAFFQRFESRLLIGARDAAAFRSNIQKTYATVTLTQEMLRDDLPITRTTLYQYLHERYVHNLKEKVLEPFLKNENFRRAIKDYNEESFKTYDRKIQDDIHFLMDNLHRKHGYSRQGAKEICIYVIDKNLAGAFADK